MSELKNKCTTAQQKQSFNRLAWTNQLKNETVDVEQVSIVLGGGRVNGRRAPPAFVRTIASLLRKVYKSFFISKTLSKKQYQSFLQLLHKHPLTMRDIDAVYEKKVAYVCAIKPVQYKKIKIFRKKTLGRDVPWWWNEQWEEEMILTSMLF